MSKYITGEELFGQGFITAIELGELCRDGYVMAWCEPGLTHYSTKDQYDFGIHSTSVILFPFDIEDFVEAYKDELGGAYYNASTMMLYQDKLSKMTFILDEVHPYLHIPQRGGGGSKLSLDMPSSLFAGKSAEAACIAMLESDFSKEIIAYVLVEKLGISKEAAAYALFDENKDVSVLRKRITRMVKEVKEKYDIHYV